MSALGEKARTAVIWNAGFNVFRDLLQFGMMVVLVRILEPAAYGKFGLVTTIIGFINIFSFNNFLAHTLQVKGNEDVHFQEHFTAGAALQIGMFGVANILAFGLRWSPTYAPIAPLVHIMSLTFLLEWPCNLRVKMFEREFDWKRLRILHAVALVITSILAVIMAELGAGTYALLVPGLLVTLPFIYDLFVREHWRPTWAWSWQAYKPAWNFGVTRIGSGVTLNGRQLLESGVLSAVLGFAALGIFNRSLGLAQIFCSKIAMQLMYAIYPMLTRMGEGEENSKRVAGLVLRTVAWAVLPMAVCFSMLAQPVVDTVYGAKWMDVVPLLPWAMAWGTTGALFHAGYMLLLARQQQQKCLVADILNLAATGLCLWLALPHGVTVYLAAQVLAQGLLFTLVVFWLWACKAVAWMGVVDAALPPLAAATGAVLFATALHSVFVLDQNAILQAILWGLAFLVAYVGLLRIGFPTQLSQLVHYFPGRERIGRWLLLPPFP